MRNLKRMMAILCAVALVVTSFGGFGSVYADTTNTKSAKKPAVAVNYQEVPDKYRAAMQRAVEMGLLTPGKDGKLRPNDIMTVAEYATVQWRLYGQWYGKEQSKDFKYAAGKLYINNKDASKHWARLPLEYASFSAWPDFYNKTIKPPNLDIKFRGEYNINAEAPLIESMLYTHYSMLFLTLMHHPAFKSGKADYLIDEKTDSVDIVWTAVRQNKEFEAIKLESVTILGLKDTIYDGVYLLQSADLMSRADADGKLPIHPTRKISRAEAVYYTITMENYLKARGFTNVDSFGPDKFRNDVDAIKH